MRSQQVSNGTELWGNATDGLGNAMIAGALALCGLAGLALLHRTPGRVVAGVAHAFRPARLFSGLSSYKAAAARSAPGVLATPDLRNVSAVFLVLCLIIGVALGDVLITLVLVAFMVTTVSVAMAVRTSRHRANVDRELVEAVEIVAEEMRAGATPTTSLGLAAANAAEPVKSVLTSAALASSVGGDVSSALREAAYARMPQRPDTVAQLAAAWEISASCGASLSTLFDHVERDIRARRRFAAQLDAALAGPRATAALLALLPAFGLLLGTAMGANPLAVLLHTSAGRIALVMGTGFEIAGVLWIHRLLRRAVSNL